MLLLVIQIAAGAAVYLGAAVLLKVESYRYLIETAMLYLGKKK